MVALSHWMPTNGHLIKRSKILVRPISSHLIGETWKNRAIERNQSNEARLAYLFKAGNGSAETHAEAMLGTL